MRLPFRKPAELLQHGAMFETKSHEWEQAGLTQTVSPEDVVRARRQAVILIVLLGGVLALNAIFGTYTPGHSVVTGRPIVHDRSWVHILSALAILVLGWAFAGDVGKAAAPTFFRRMDPATAGPVGFTLRLATVVVTIIGALNILGVPLTTLAFGGSITAIVIGLAAQQTLGNLFAGMVLLSARPFRVGMGVRLQAGALGGPIEGIVSSQGLLYTELTRGQDVVLIPNTVVLAAVIVPVREPEPVDVKVKLRRGISATAIQEILDDYIKTPTRREPRVQLEEIDDDSVVVRIMATPERTGDGAKLADEVIAAVVTVTGEQPVVPAPAALGDQAADQASEQG